MIIYNGPSVLDGAPIVAIATFGTNNVKTGDMIQVWIIRSDIAPHKAVQSGDDVSVCGTCPHRHGVGGDCYVLPFQAPLAVFRAYQRGSYPALDLAKLAGKQIRFGAYGDPAAVPMDAWQPILEVCDRAGSTGYTHQLRHRNFDARIATFCQISADTPKQAAAAHARGLHTFRVAGDAALRLPGEIECLADSAGITCAQCKLCNGQQQSIVIAAHGGRSKTTKQHDYIVRSA